MPSPIPICAALTPSFTFSHAMEHADVSALLDALTGGTERFGEVLAAPCPPPEFAPFEMPLLAAHQPPPDPLSPTPLFGFEPGPTPVEYTLPVSAVTGVSGVSSRSEGIRKKRQRGSPVRAKKEVVLTISQAESDVSTTSPKAEVKVEARVDTKVPPKSHTRKCREKVTRQFENLLEVLPRPRKGVEVKHKAQILEYTIKVFRGLLLRRTSLQTEIALASKSSMRNWMRGVEGGVAEVLAAFVGLHCVKGGWKYGELWTVGDGVGLGNCVFNTDNEGVLARLDRFATVSRSRYTRSKGVKGVIGRVMATKQPERLDALGDCDRTFERAALAKEVGMHVAEAVPVVADGTVRAVLLFGDVQRHDFAMSEMMTLLQYCEVLAELYGKEGHGKTFDDEFV